jgi:hypothetical protein
MNKYTEKHEDEATPTETKHWYDSSLLVAAFYVFGILIAAKNFILAYRSWEPITMGLCIFWMLVFCLCLHRMRLKKEEK